MSFVRFNKIGAEVVMATEDDGVIPALEDNDNEIHLDDSVFLITIVDVLIVVSIGKGINRIDWDVETQLMTSYFSIFDVTDDVNFLATDGVITISVDVFDVIGPFRADEDKSLVETVVATVLALGIRGKDFDERTVVLIEDECLSEENEYLVGRILILEIADTMIREVLFLSTYNLLF